ncbi:hypothetical protein D0T53_11655 [Dysgonomonas sp. 216]|nr:hypothetical protein [Dysgonomonas sp. 216]
MSILLSSCHSLYYYAQFDTNNPYIERDEKNNFVVTGGHVKLTFSFHGKDAQSKIIIENIGNENIYINWEDSWIYQNERNSQSYKYSYSHRLTNNTNIENKLTLIEPGEKTTQYLLKLKNIPLHKIDNELFTEDSIAFKHKGMANVKSSSFKEYDSPFNLKYTIAVTIGENTENTHMFEGDFFIANVSKANDINANRLAPFHQKDGSFFYYEEEISNPFKESLGDLITFAGSLIMILIALYA